MNLFSRLWHTIRRDGNLTELKFYVPGYNPKELVMKHQDGFIVLWDKSGSVTKLLCGVPESNIKNIVSAEYKWGVLTVKYNTGVELDGENIIKFNIVWQ